MQLLRFSSNLAQDLLLNAKAKMYLSNLFKEVFIDDETPLLLLKKYNMENGLEKSVQSINDILEKPPVSITSLIALAPSILILVNNKLRLVSDPNDKQKLEVLATDVIAHLFKKAIEKSNQPATTLMEIKSSLEKASHLHDFNFEALLKLLKYDQLESNYKDETFWYEWNGKLHELDELARQLRRQGIIKSVKAFKELFRNHNNPNLSVQFSNANVPFLLALFDELKDYKLIIPKGGNGHFHPIRIYGVDFQKNILIKNEPKLIKAKAKQNADKWLKIKIKAKEFVLSIKDSVTSKSP